MEIKGTITKVMAPVSGESKTTGKKWMRQEFLLRTEGNYPNLILFTVFGEEKIGVMDLKEGDVGTVFFDIDAREYNSRWYNDVQAYKFDRGEQQPEVEEKKDTPQAVINRKQGDTIQELFGGEDDGKLPF